MRASVTEAQLPDTTAPTSTAASTSTAGPVEPAPSEPVELAPSEAAGQQVALAALPSGRRAVLGRLKAAGEATADQVASELGITVGAVRQLLGPLGEAGLVAHRDDRHGPGRPRRWYCLTPAAEALFPKRYGQLTNQLLGFIEDANPALVTSAFEQRAEQRRVRAAPRLAAAGSLEDQVIELARILDEDGYLADCAPAPNGGWLVTERNCAILDVARHHRQACGSELAFLREVLPNATVERVAHLLSGGRHCAYRIAPLQPAGPDEAVETTDEGGRTPPAPDIQTT
jgi:DeoR family transcriptional regulator, suf operon transcriptional repressor